jgi:peptide deformylase
MEIITAPDPILKGKAKPVEKITKEIISLVQEMKKTMIKNKGVGLAANQIGKDISIFVAYDGKKFYEFINPQIIKFIGEPVELEEGCLSLPGVWGLVKRYPEVIVEYKNLRNKKKKLKAKDLLAQIIQHEIDHLNGTLFIDKAVKIYQPEEK